jgi:hypothetical protein
MHVSQVRSELRSAPPFAPAYVSYTYRLQAFIEDLRGCMTVADLAAVTGLSWDTVKNIALTNGVNYTWQVELLDQQGHEIVYSPFAFTFTPAP